MGKRPPQNRNKDRELEVIGRKPVLELLESGKPVKRVSVSLGAQGRIIGQIISAAKERKIRIDRIEASRVNKVMGNGNHQGVMAEISPVKLHTLEELTDGAIPVKSGMILALDGVTDPHHLGASARSALAAGCDALLLTGRRSAPIRSTAIKASMGALLRIPVVEVVNLVNALNVLKDNGWWIYGAVMRSGESIWKTEWNDQCVVVIGSEESGLSQLTRKVCDKKVHIPMFGELDSLSVSVASSLFMFELARYRLETGSSAI